MGLESVEAKRNLNRQGTKVLRDIVNAYETGVFEDPSSSRLFCTLLALICEGKVQGLLDESSGLVKWSLTKEYSEELEQLKANLLQAGLQSGKIVHGPWQQ